MRVVAMTAQIATNVAAQRLHWPVMRDKLVVVINVLKCLFSWSSSHIVMHNDT